MKILSFNVRVWTRNTSKKKAGYWKDRARLIAEEIVRINPDIILFQEMIYPMTNYIPAAYKKATGCSVSHHIYCRKAFQVLSHEWHMRWCRAVIRTDMGEEINAFSVHTHWDEDIYRKTCTEITSHLEGGMHNIAGGDWNNIPEVIQPLVKKPMVLARTGHITFQDWESGKEAELDFFACWPQDGKAEIASDISRLSDHRPVMLTLDTLLR